MKYLIDASVVVAGLEEGHSTAGKILDEGDLGIIDLTRVEVANAFRYKGSDRESISIALGLLYGEQVKCLEYSESDLLDTTMVSLELNTTVYDTLYHMVAKKHGLEFLTMDAKYFKKAEKLGGLVLLK